MRQAGENWIKGTTLMVRIAWHHHREALLHLSVAVMGSASVVWLTCQFWRLLFGDGPIWSTSPIGAVDLIIRQDEVRSWFDGIPRYEGPACAMDPPATYAILWPVVGWLSRSPVRWLWAVTTAVALRWLIYTIVQGSGADTKLERLFVSMLPLSMYATGATVGNGQLIVHVLPLLLTGILFQWRRADDWARDTLAAALIVVALARPSVAAPFFWVVLFFPGRLRVPLLAAAAYRGTRCSQHRSRRLVSAFS